jgi:hypothetical protein
MAMMIDRFVVMIGMFYFWYVDTWEVDNYSIWKDRLSFLIFVIEVGNEFSYLDVTKTPF